MNAGRSSQCTIPVRAKSYSRIRQFLLSLGITYTDYLICVIRQIDPYYLDIQRAQCRVGGSLTASVNAHVAVICGFGLVHPFVGYLGNLNNSLVREFTAHDISCRNSKLIVDRARP